MMHKSYLLIIICLLHSSINQLIDSDQSISDVNTMADFPASNCFPRPFPCDENHKYRLISGWCNNLQRPFLGVGQSAYRRLLPAAYDDSISEPRQRGQSGHPLPGPRLVAVKAHQAITREDSRHTLLLMQWGQFVGHDCSLTPMETAVGDSGPNLDCSACDSHRTVSPNCLPVPIPDNDPIFGPAFTPGSLCFPFVRSKATPQKSGIRSQMNQFTSYLDLSHLYGSDDCRALEVRGDQHTGGRIESQISQEGETLPAGVRNRDGCRSEGSRPCFFSGDSRANEHMALGSMHVMFLREHNSIADRLASLNPSWNDEKLYQESRRITIALFQHITYSELLPRLLGPQSMTEFDLHPRSDGFFNGYDSNCDVTITNEFTTAAFRFGHSLVPMIFPIMDHNYRSVQSISLNELFFNPGRLYQRRFCDQFIMGMISEPIQAFDRFITPALRDRLFGFPSDSKSGLDLASMNIQRGRDHGLAPYTRYRERFQLPVPSNFGDLLAWMENSTVAALASVYESVHDIDLFTGLLSEKSQPGGIVGPTAAKIIGDQFHRSRKCDRFWYENSNQAGSFTLDQLIQIRQQSVAHILCRNLPMIESIQPQALDRPDQFTNTRVSCKNFQSIDLSIWAQN